MSKNLPELHVYDQPTSLSQIAQDQLVPITELVNFATGHYGAKMLRFGDSLAEGMNGRMMRGAYAPYAQEIDETVDIINLTGVKTLQHSFTVGCSSVVRDSGVGSTKSPSLMGTIDWEQVGENLSSVVSLSVLENPIKPESPIASVQIGPAAFGLFMMNSKVAIKANRAPIPNIRNKKIDLNTVTEDEYKRIKARNNLPYSLKSVANQVFTGRPSCAYLLRHAVNLDMDFHETLDFLVNTKTCDSGIMTVTGHLTGQAATVEKRWGQSFVYSGYEAAANHWNENSPFAARNSLPRTLNSKDRAGAIADRNRKGLFLNPEFSFANKGVVDQSTRIIANVNPATGEISIVTMHGENATSKAVSAYYNGQSLEDIRHFDLDIRTP